VIEDEMTKYRLAQNPVLHFFESSVEIETGSKIRRPSLYEAFQKWSQETGMDSSALRSRQRFFKDFENVLDSKGIALKQKRINGYEYVVNISIKNFS
jgi:phage/plasmid-associated DNA primase